MLIATNNKLENNVNTGILVVRLPVTNNVNQLTPTLLNVFGSVEKNTITGASINAQSITLPTGDYIFDIWFNLLNNSGARTNIALIASCGTYTNQRDGNNYIRRATGHNESSQAMTDWLYNNSINNLQFSTVRLANAGNVTVTSGSLIIRKV